MTNILYGYNTKTKKKFIVSVEEICQAINSGDGFSDNYFVYSTEEDRDFYYYFLCESVRADKLNEERAKKLNRGEWRWVEI